MNNLKFNELLNLDDENNWTFVESKKKQVYVPKINNKLFDSSEKNLKKILCNNILKYKKCTYGNKCMYAHSLEEQNVDNIKKRAYDILRSENIMDIDLSKEDKLAKIFLQFTKICPDCKNKVCPGGYNCKYGAMDEKYIICYDDVTLGNCRKENCNYIHLTKRGIKPISHNVIKQPSRIENNFKRNFQLTNISNGTVLNDDFFVSLGLNKNNSSDVDSDGESMESIEKIKEYLEEYDSDENCDKSIFIYKN